MPLIDGTFVDPVLACAPTLSVYTGGTAGSAARIVGKVSAVRVESGESLSISDFGVVLAQSGATVHAFGNGTVYACGAATVHAHDDVNVEASGDVRIFLYGRARAVAFDASHVTAHDESSVVGRDSCRVRLFDRAEGKGFNLARIFAADAARASVYDLAALVVDSPDVRVSARGAASVAIECSAYPRVSASDYAKVSVPERGQLSMFSLHDHAELQYRAAPEEAIPPRTAPRRRAEPSLAASKPVVIPPPPAPLALPEEISSSAPPPLTATPVQPREEQLPDSTPSETQESVSELPAMKESAADEPTPTAAPAVPAVNPAAAPRKRAQAKVYTAASVAKDKAARPAASSARGLTPLSKKKVRIVNSPFKDFQVSRAKEGNNSGSSE